MDEVRCSQPEEMRDKDLRRIPYQLFHACMTTSYNYLFANIHHPGVREAAPGPHPRQPRPPRAPRPGRDGRRVRRRWGRRSCRSSRRRGPARVRAQAAAAARQPAPRHRHGDHHRRGVRHRVPDDAGGGRVRLRLRRHHGQVPAGGEEERGAGCRSGGPARQSKGKGAAGECHRLGDHSTERVRERDWCVVYVRVTVHPPHQGG